uniref:Uncharacterized protein n=1 Tax=Ornithodoros erraticus TaxID=265619 RepID=A0A293N605_ORNER
MCPKRRYSCIFYIVEFNLSAVLTYASEFQMLAHIKWSEYCSLGRKLCESFVSKQSPAICILCYFKFLPAICSC